MRESTGPRLAKWPFFVADVVLLAIAAGIVSQAAKPLSAGPLIAVVMCADIGAWACVTP
jgi:hypothetical protein